MQVLASHFNEGTAFRVARAVEATCCGAIGLRRD
jgi:hypothetical protein